MGGPLQPPLPGDDPQGGILDGELDGTALDALAAHAPRHLVGQRADAHARVLPARQIPPEGHAVAHGFHGAGVIDRGHGALVQPVGVFPELLSQLAQTGPQRLFVCKGDLPDGADAHPCQRQLDPAPHEQQGVGRLWPDQIGHILPSDDSGGVGLFMVGAQLGKDLVEGHPHRDGQPRFLPHLPAQTVGDGLPVAEERAAPRHVQPAFVDAEGLHLLGIALIDGVDHLRPAGIVLVMRRHQHQLGAFCLGFADGLRCLHAEALGQLVFGKNDPVAAFGVAAHRHGDLFELRMLELLAGGVKAVAVAMQDGAVAHRTVTLPSTCPMGSRRISPARPS